MTREEAIEVIKTMGTDLQISFFSSQGKALLLALRSLEAWGKYLDALNDEIEKADIPYSDTTDAYRNGLVKAKWLLLTLKEVEE